MTVVIKTGQGDVPFPGNTYAKETGLGSLNVYLRGDEGEGKAIAIFAAGCWQSALVIQDEAKP